MSSRAQLAEQVAQAFRDHGLTAAIATFFGGIVTGAWAVVRMLFTNKAMLDRLEAELRLQRDHQDSRRDDDRAADGERLERIERDLQEIRKLLFKAFRHGGRD